MINVELYGPRLLPKEENFSQGHRACQGCAEALAVRIVCKALGRNAVVAMSTGCMEIVSTPLPTTAWKIPWIHVAFENSAAVASGVEVGLKALMRKGKLPHRKISIAGMAGDGGTADIGLQALSGAMERGHDMIFVCYDNEAYMNTGIQRSSSTPFGASTTTSPAGRVKAGQETWKKNMPEIMAAHDIPYVATACSSYPLDLFNKVKRAMAVKGPAYVHVLSVCPTGWRIPSGDAIKYGRLAVETGAFALYEVVDGKHYLTFDFPQLKPVTDYFKGHGRFRHLTPDMVAKIQTRIVAEYDKLKAKCVNIKK
jgi:pyruvate ferredoxin oxidoreductase beta subunit